MGHDDAREYRKKVEEVLAKRQQLVEELSAEEAALENEMREHNVKRLLMSSRSSLIRSYVLYDEEMRERKRALEKKIQHAHEDVMRARERLQIALEEEGAS